MAFTGTATIQQISDRVVKITDLTLGNGAAGTIGLAGGTGEVSLPAAFLPKPNTIPYGPSGAARTVTLGESVRVSVQVAGASPNPVSVTVAESPLLWTITNTAAGATSGAFVIWVEDLG